MFNQLLLNGIIAGSIYGLTALGFTIIYRTVKFFHLAHGIVYTAGAYFAYTFLNSLTHKLPNSTTSQFPNSSTSQLINSSTFFWFLSFFYLYSSAQF